VATADTLQPIAIPTAQLIQQTHAITMGQQLRHGGAIH
jgi:hypothetical protein